MQYTLFPLGIEPRQPPEWAMAYAQSEMQTSTLNHRHSPLSQPRGAGDQRDHHSHRRLATEAPAGRSRRRRRLDRMTLYTLAVLRRDFFASYVQSGFQARPAVRAINCGPYFKYSGPLLAAWPDLIVPGCPTRRSIASRLPRLGRPYTRCLGIPLTDLYLMRISHYEPRCSGQYCSLSGS